MLPNLPSGVSLAAPFPAIRVPLRAVADLRGGTALARPKILIVEDNPLLAVNIEDWLTDAGYEVVGVAAAGVQALLLAAKHKPALAIMDIRLAGHQNGVDVAIIIRELYGTWSVFASAHGAPDMKARANLAKPAGWLTKPYSMDQLIEAVAIALAAKTAT